MRRWLVRDMMTGAVVTVGERAPYKEIVEKLSKHAVGAVPVVTEDRRVVGVVSEADLLHKMEFAGLEPHLHLLERKRRRMARAKAGADTAADLMTSPAIVIGASESLTTAAKLMDAEGVKRLPVVDEYGHLVGILSRRDLLRLYLRPDDAIRDEVTDEVLLRSLWMEPGTVSVSVERGVVTLAGTVDRRSTVPLVVRLVGSVAGVVEVVDHLSYRYDDTADLHRHHLIGATVRETVP
jgi:CBS-domain-containing membrane protein